jgi:MoaA/NifB/PqqE/SkfB family radical SAM enzyme
MEVKDAHAYLAEAAAVSHLESFMVFGGEPMLYPDRATAIFKKANELRIPKIDMLTNGVWGKNKKNAEELATKLKEAGLNIVGISVDAFHLPFIPLEHPRNAALALLKAGVENVTWNVTVIESIDAINEFDKKTSQILKTLEPEGIDAHIHKIIPVGRATQTLSKYFPHMPLEGPCTSDPILGNVLTDPESICIEPSGEVDICWHLAVGNAKETPLSSIISKYNWREYPTIKTLVEHGPMGLLKAGENAPHQSLMKRYINKCHLCTEIRRTVSPY